MFINIRLLIQVTGKFILIQSSRLKILLLFHRKKAFLRCTTWKIKAFNISFFKGKVKRQAGDINEKEKILIKILFACVCHINYVCHFSHKELLWHFFMMSCFQSLFAIYLIKNKKKLKSFFHTSLGCSQKRLLEGIFLENWQKNDKFDKKNLLKLLFSSSLIETKVSKASKRF